MGFTLIGDSFLVPAIIRIFLQIVIKTRVRSAGYQTNKAADFMISKTDVLIQSRCGQLQTFTDSQKTPKKFTFSLNMYKVFSDFFYLFYFIYVCILHSCGNVATIIYYFLVLTHINIAINGVLKHAIKWTFSCKVGEVN